MRSGFVHARGSGSGRRHPRGRLSPQHKRGQPGGCVHRRPGSGSSPRQRWWPPTCLFGCCGPPIRWQCRARILAYARREAVEVIRDRVRLAFAFLGSAILMLVFCLRDHAGHRQPGFCTTSDLSQSPESRAYIAEIAGSRYFNPVHTAVGQRRRWAVTAADLGRCVACYGIPAGFRAQTARRRADRGAGNRGRCDPVQGRDGRRLCCRTASDIPECMLSRNSGIRDQPEIARYRTAVSDTTRASRASPRWRLPCRPSC